MRAMIFAAGLGTRFQPHTLKRPKPCLPFLNQPLISFPLYYLEQVGIEKLVVNLHHLPDMVRNTVVGLTSRKDYSTVFSLEQPKILNSGGGLFKVKEFFEGTQTFLVVNADAVMLAPPKFLTDAIRFHRDCGALATLVGCSHPMIGRGLSAIWTDSRGQITGFGPKPPAGKNTGFHFTGFFIFSKEIFDFLSPEPTNLIHDNLKAAIAAGKKTLVYNADPCLWFETGSEKEYILSTQDCLSQLFEEGPHTETLKNMMEHFHNRFTLQEEEGARILRSENVSIPPSTRLSGDVVLGQNLKLPESMTLENAVVAEGASLKLGVAIQHRLVL